MSDDASMYAVFDSFLAADTWHTTHPLDGRRFFLALDKVVRNENFNADKMAAYIYDKTGVSPHIITSCDPYAFGFLGGGDFLLFAPNQNNVLHGTDTPLIAERGIAHPDQRGCRTCRAITSSRCGEGDERRYCCRVHQL